MNRQDHTNECNDKIDELKERIDVCYSRCSRIFENYIADKDWEEAIRQLSQIKADNDSYLCLNRNDLATPLNVIYDFFMSQVTRINQQLNWIQQVSE